MESEMYQIIYSGLLQGEPKSYGSDGNFKTRKWKLNV